MILAYASRTGTRRNLEALHAADWFLLVSAKGVHRHEGFRYAIDNGAWTAHTQAKPFDERAFVAVVEKLGGGADWIALPDIVCGGLSSLEMSKWWLSWVSRFAPVLYPVQDGMGPEDVRHLLHPEAGIFVGGSTEWKLDTLSTWAALAREVGCWLHVGRVNTVRRIRRCIDVGATSFDGTAVTKYAVELPKLQRARTMGALFYV